MLTLRTLQWGEQHGYRIAHLLNITSIFSLCLIFAASVVAQENIHTSLSSSDVTPVIRVSSQFVVLDALVENRKTGNLVGNLEAKDFRVAEDKDPQNISYFSHDQLPLSVVFLFDLTDTVQPILKPLAQGASEILAHLKPQDEASIMVFSSHTELLQDFATDRTLTSAAIEKASEMKSKDGTFIHEDMYEAIDQAMKSTVPESRRVLVWLTDGTANFENSLTQKTIGKQAPAHLHTKEETTTKLLRSGVVVAALIDRSAGTDAFLAAQDITPFSFIAGGRIGDINKYADLTGGPVLKSGKKEVAERLSELIDELRGRYTLGYKPSTSKPAGSFCKLEVMLSSAAYQEHTNFRKQDLLVRTKHGYYR
jgi:VWFA-related protein